MNFCRYLSLLILFFSASALSTDHVVMNRPHNTDDLRLNYPFGLAELALEASKSKFGAYTLERSSVLMKRNRQLLELKRGDLLNVLVSPPKPGWEGQAIRVQFPIYKGIASYRIALLNEENKHITKDIENIEQLKRLSAGADNQWSTTIILRNNNFNLVLGAHYSTLFKMLANKRFQTFPRGLNEIYLELERFQPTYPNLIADEHVAVFMYLPGYFYVSKKTPRIAERLEYGLNKIFENGEFDNYFYKHFGKDIEQGKLHQRKIFYLENTNLSPEMFKNDKKYLMNYATDFINES